MIEISDEVVYVERFDSSELLGSYLQRQFLLDGYLWPTVEHYYQATKFSRGEYYDRICNAPDGATATALGEARFKRRLKDWKKNRIAYMTRAVYTNCKSYSDVTSRLLDTGSKQIIERSMYDYYWGTGRDGRGENQFGKLLMRVRLKLREETMGGA